MTGQREAPGAGQGFEGGTENRGGSKVVRQFTPTPAEQKKYADYSVEFREWEGPVEIEVHGGTVLRFASTVRRVPSTKTFIVYIRSQANKLDRQLAAHVGRRMPHGEWARMADMWTQRRAKNGQVFFQQMRGFADDEPLLLLELEMQLENTSLIESDIDRPRLLT